MEAIRFHVVVGEEQVIRPPAGVSIPVGEVEVEVRPVGRPAVPARIVDRGRGPEIAGSRVTVYDVLYESDEGLAAAEIARLFELQVEQVEAALKYIEDHKAEVRRDYEQIRQRHAGGNPPQVQAKLDATHAAYADRWSALRQAQTDGNQSRGHPRGH